MPVNISLPDGTVKSFDDKINGFQIASEISEAFARDCIAMEIKDKLYDLNTQITKNTKITFIRKNDDKALAILRHSAAHIMAQAITNLYKDAKPTIGPVIKDGFYYDIDVENISNNDFEKIEAEMKKIVKAKIPIKKKILPKNKALELYKHNKYKIELINELEDDNITIYEQGDFSDLCRGPHIPHTGFLKAFKLMSVSGAYWRADQKKEQLQRIYGTAFLNKKKLNKYLIFLEEAKKRDHRKIGTELNLFSFHKEAAGMPFFHSNGMIIWNELIEYWREEHKKAGYVETKTPIMLNKKLWEKSGHWFNYRENMYTSEIDNIEYAIKPMNCPGGMLIFGETSHSYRDLPLRVGEIGLVHRHELSGVLSGLFRVRAFHQDDAHIFMTESQIEDEILNVLNLSEKIYSQFGLDFNLELSTRPKKFIGSDAEWEIATKSLENALKKYHKQYRINEGDGAFYGPKIDMHIKDAIGRTWQCGTIQLDMLLPERFDLNYTGEDGKKHRPVMVHRTIYGSLERFFGILIEHFAGKFPIWLAPTQAILLPITDELAPFATTILEKFENSKIRTKIDKRAESLNKKIRDAQMARIPIIIIIGKKERDTKTLSYRTLDGKIKMNLDIDDFIKETKKSINKK